MQRLHHGTVERVALVGPVEGEPQDARAPLGEKDFAHFEAAPAAGRSTASVAQISSSPVRASTSPIGT